MKEIKAIIKPDVLEKVMSELRKDARLPGATICEVSSFGRERASDTSEDSSATPEGFGRQKMIKLEIIVPDHTADFVRDLIAAHARTGQPGDGLILIIPVESGVRIRSGQAIEEGA